MMTAEENDLLVPRRGRCADGPDHAPPLDRGLPVGGSGRARRRAGQGAAARRGSRRVPRQQGPRRRARRILLAPARVAGCSRATRNAACVASITAGNSTWTATWSRWRPSRANSLIPERVKHKAYPAREAGGFVWAYMGPPDEMREFEAPAFAPTPDARVSATKVRVALQLGADPRRADRFRAFLEPAFVRHGAGARSTAPRRPKRTGCAPRPTRRRASRSSAPATDFATRRSGARS